ncbi:ChrR family anti-sigma-E factor [uncultured Shewanella sp.]|uniref:ChrR family anti-sigma-E factor n=1 Tax=uncultured Shewanella sp. TaxID=173975 RepID=UPI00262C29CA|nr:ChrR family anti-sigma-E factor [uncultured Shewanella sp.]
MINYHPSDAILTRFVEADLSISLSIIVSSHIEMCTACQQKVAKLTEEAASLHFQLADNDIHGTDTVHVPMSEPDTDLINKIINSPQEDTFSLPKTITEIEVEGQRLPLPMALQSIALNEWQGIGKISRSRLNVDDDERRMSLLSIAKTGSVPRHTHKGFEITLLLQGSFEDEMGTYQAGDFIWLNDEHTHQPVSKSGCVCLTVSSDALKFTQGISQILNPLGKLIY